MGFKLGLVGLPNVGKSTLFNALTRTAKAEVANYPFCTIEPNVGIVAVPDERLPIIAQREGSARVVPAVIEFVDIAGLVKNASKGEGLGNQFLAHLREVDALALVLRCFEDENIVHVEGTVDPVRDAEIVELELMAKDLETVERRLSKVAKPARSGDKNARKEVEHLERLKAILEALEPVRKHTERLSAETLKYARKVLFLLTVKPMIYIANVGESGLSEGSSALGPLVRKAEEEGIPLISVCAELEAQLTELPEEEREEMLEAYGLKESGLSKVIREGYRLLDLVTFFTVNEKEVRAWTVPQGTPVVKAAGKIHSDMERGFIAAEVINFKDYFEVASLSEARQKGRLRLEGRDYLLQDGDLVYIRFKA